MAGRRGVDIQEWATRLGYRPVERRPGEVRWWVVIPLAFVTTFLALAVPALRLPVSAVWGFGAVACFAWRARHEAAPAAGVWWRFTVGGLFLMVGLAIRIALSSEADPYPLPSAADLFMIPGYVLLLLGGWSVAHERSGGEPRDGDRFDAAIVAGTAALVVWSLVVAPVISDSSLPVAERGLEVLYTVLALGLIYFVVEGGLGPGYPSASLRLLLAFAVFLWVIDAFGADDVAAQNLGDLLFLAVPIPASLAAAAALEPSARWAFAGPDPEVGDRQTLRFVIAGAVLVVGPGVQIALPLVGGDDSGGWVAAVGSALLSVLIFARLVRLVQESRRPPSDHEQELERLRGTNTLLRQLDLMARDDAAPVDVAGAAVEVGGRAGDLLHAEVMALVVVDNAQGIWMPRLQQGCELEPVTEPEHLPAPLDEVATGRTGVVALGRPARGEDGPTHPLVPGSRSGIYAPLLGREGIIGVFAVEHSEPGRWGLHDLRLVGGLVQVLAVTADNARSVRRLQTRGAIEHRHDTARELHDQFGQVLTTLGLEVDRLRSSGGADAEDLDKLREAVSAASLEVRAALRALRAPPPSDAGFPGAARDLVDRLRGTGPTIHLEVDDAGRRPGPEVEQQMVGILQEALTNTRRHAKASKATVRWAVSAEGAARLEIEDDGVGFVPPSEAGGTIGLVGMAERAELLDGHLRVHSAPGEGCRIVVEAPPWEGGGS